MAEATRHADRPRAVVEVVGSDVILGAVELQPVDQIDQTARGGHGLIRQVWVTAFSVDGGGQLRCEGFQRISFLHGFITQQAPRLLSSGGAGQPEGRSERFEPHMEGLERPLVFDGAAVDGHGEFDRRAKNVGDANDRAGEGDVRGAGGDCVRHGLDTDLARISAQVKSTRLV